MKHAFWILVLIIVLGSFGVVFPQALDTAAGSQLYRLPFAKLGGDDALISIANRHDRAVRLTVTVKDQFDTPLDKLSDALAAQETRSFPVSSLPAYGTSLEVVGDADLQISLTYRLDGMTFETRIVEPERDGTPSLGTTEEGDNVADGKPGVARFAITQTTGSYCGGQTSLGNPFPCGNGGNCTWWAWKMAKDNWGVDFPARGNANTWATAARNNNYQVSSTPAPQTIGVNTTMLGGLGHVFWVTSVNGNQVCGTEMLWGSYGSRSNCYPTSTFNAGYIYPPSLTVVSPNGGEYWTRGAQRTISWSATGNPGAYVRIELLKYGSLVSIISSSVPRGQTAGSFVWSVPFPLAGGSGYLFGPLRLR